jgi:hypothetical protein
VEGFGPLTDGTFRGATITGSGTTTLPIVNATSPIVNGLPAKYDPNTEGSHYLNRRFYFEVK